MATFKVFYTTLSTFGEFGITRKPTVRDLPETHVFVTSVDVDAGPAELETVFVRMQAENWSPNGEAMQMIERIGASHTSMSVGDVIECGGRHWVVLPRGFAEIE